ncbi:MAG: Unknown protein [uncultured Sulfurovum sp.]|uniref:Helix-turn-helix containsing protein n=1 Tax=uncultured Sulfurovum sp. TaxID=269237 RepID=A0A6S6S8H8_9BACT|nr:MAG: Unknown protein [uncultured Sulfurovum sp.]
MELLEYFYDRDNNIENYHPRKFHISEAEKIFIYGSPASGKTSLVLDYLKNYDSEKILYIDFQDPKFAFRDVMEEDIQSFVMVNEIDYLVLDHYEHEYFETLPQVKQLIILSSSFYEYEEEIETLELPLLDYEEFYSFQKRGTERQIFNHFIRRGTLPALAIQSIPKEQLFLNFIRSHFNESEQKLLGVLAHFNGATVTTFQLYTHAKERYKISKDLIYKQIKSFKEQGIITFINDIENPKQKRLLFFDFALAKYLTLTQNFPKQFETMIALSLVKHQVPFKSFSANAYITHLDQLILPAPFENEESFWKKAHNKFTTYKKQNIKKVYIITVGTNFEFRIENIIFEALPFYEWVVINDES